MGTDDGSGNLTSSIYLRPARSTVELTNDIMRYMLESTILRFSGVTDQLINIEYVPEAPSVFTLANIQAGAGVEIDELTDYHDLIALLAYRHYAIKDFNNNPVVELQMNERKQELINYLQEGRSFNARSTVIAVDELDYFNP